MSYGEYASRATNNAFVDKTTREEGQTVIQWNTFITEKDKILPHYLRDNNYVTGMVGKNHVIEARGLYRFPDFQSDPNDPEIKLKIEENYNKTRAAILKNGFDYAEAIYHNNPNFIGVAKLAVQNLDWITEAGTDFIDKYHQKPFFLYFATTVPHGPTEAARSWNADPRITAKGVLEEAPKVLPPRHTLPNRLKKAGLGGKRKENILWLDDALGALLQRLEKHQILDNTIIFFFNDHGQHAKGTLYQGGIHNPSIIWKSDGFKCKNRSNALVTNIDFAPTILEMAGIDYQLNEFDGESFNYVLEGKNAKSSRKLFFELGYGRAIIKGKYKYYAIRYPEYASNWTLQEREEVLDKYNDGRRFRNMRIVNEDPTKRFSHLEVIPGGGQAEHKSYGIKTGYFDADQLYNLEEDSIEMVNLATDKDHQKILKELQGELQKYLDALPGTFHL